MRCAECPAWFLLACFPALWGAQTGFSAEAITAPDSLLSNRVERAYQRVLELDDRARSEIDEWIKVQQSDPQQDTPLLSATLKGRIEERLETVRKAYNEFLEEFPNHAEGRLAFGSFLNEIQEEHAAQEQWEKSRLLDPANPAAWNNLGNYYGHNGQPAKAFEYYEKAIALNPSEPVYYQNLATTLYLFRRDGTNYYKLPLIKVLEKAMSFYAKALELDPDNFILASEIAQTYYGIPAPKSGTPQENAAAQALWHDKALDAWRRAYQLARDDMERQGVQLHMARVQINAGQYVEARANLDSVTNDLYRTTKRNLLKLLDGKEKPVVGQTLE